MALRLLPLIDKYDDKQCRHAEINPRHIKRNNLTQDPPGNRTNHPVTPRQKSHPEHDTLILFTGIRQGTVHGVGLIRHCMYHI